MTTYTGSPAPALSKQPAAWTTILVPVVVVAVVLIGVAVAMVAAVVPVIVQINTMASRTTSRTRPPGPPVQRASMMSTHAACTMVRRRRLIESYAPAPCLRFLQARWRAQREGAALWARLGVKGHSDVLAGRSGVLRAGSPLANHSVCAHTKYS